MIRLRFYLPLTLAALFACPLPVLADVGHSLVLVPFELQDDMRPSPGAPEDPAEAARVATLSARVRQAFEKSKRYRLLEGPQVETAIKRAQADQQYIHLCGPCIETIGAQTGAQYVAVGWVQRVSNLITNFNLSIVDTKTKEVADAASIDIRGNDRRSWEAGEKYLLKNLRKGL